MLYITVKGLIRELKRIAGHIETGIKYHEDKPLQEAHDDLMRLANILLDVTEGGTLNEGGVNND
jgi:hypothetical protein